MDYLTLSSVLRSNKMYLFTLEDIKNLFPAVMTKTIKNNLVRWVSDGYFIRLKRNLYEFTERGSKAVIPDLYVANRMYEPSYVSLETALSIYSIIPDVAASVTSVTTLPTRTFKNKYGSFFYRTCKSEAFTGYKIILYDGFKVNIADKEKALADFLYYYLRSGFSPDFDEERFNKRILKEINWEKVFHYAELFNKNTIKAAKDCEEYVKC